MKIVTLTMNPTIDVNSSTKNVVAEKKIRCSEPKYEPGGGGINVSRAIKKLGGSSLALYTSGGHYGNLLSELLTEENLEKLEIKIQKNTRQNLNVLEESSDQQYRFIMPGPQLSEEEIEKVFDIINNIDPKPDFIIGSGSLPNGVDDNFYAEVAGLGKKLNSKVIVDATGKPLCRAVEEGVFLIKPNMNEMKDLLGRDIENEDELINSAKELLKNDTTEAVAISLGAGGALLVTDDEHYHIKSPTVPIKSKVGAGDSMVAGIVLSLSRNSSLKDAVKFGVAAGASAVMTPGSELCNREDTERLFSQMN